MHYGLQMDVLDGWIDGWMDGWIDGWMNRWMKYQAQFVYNSGDLSQIIQYKNTCYFYYLQLPKYKPKNVDVL